MKADARATALIVKATLEGASMARKIGLDALFLDPPSVVWLCRANPNVS